MKTKKELKEQYKQQKPTAGIFQILNTVNEKVLIEAAPNMLAKWNRHRTELKFGSHRNKQLQNDWNEFGEENFKFSIVSELEIKEDADLNINEELKMLLEMVLEEVKISEEMKY